MKIFKYIIYKDIATMGIYSYFCYFIPLVAIAAEAAVGKLFWCTFFLLFFIYLELPLGVLWQDDNQGWRKFSPYFMIPRSSIVNAKYIQAVVNAVIGMAVVELCLMIGCAARGEKFFYVYNLAVISTAMFVLCCIFAAISLMLFGHKMIAIIAVSGSAGFIGGTFSNAGGEFHGGDLVNNFFSGAEKGFDFIMNANFYVGMIAVCAVIAAAIWFFTLIVYRKKDL